MSKANGDRGFTLPELMMSMSLLLIMLGISAVIFDQLQNVSDAAGSMADVNQNLRGAVNVLSRDLSMAGWNLPQKGIPIPCGGSATRIKLPGSASSYFPCTCPCNMSLVTPLYSGTAGYNASDEVVMITVNPAAAATGAVSAITLSAPTSATITVPNSLASIVTPGQLIMLLNNASNCLLAASAVNTSTNVITFTSSDTTNDVLGLNQFATNITSGSLAQLKSGGTFPATTAYLISMTTYYLNTAATPPQLMRISGSGAASTGGAQAVALGIRIFQVSYDLNDGTANQRIGSFNANNIMNANLSITGVADHPNRKSRQYYTDTINTQITLQNLAYTNKYGTSSQPNQ